MRAVQVLDDRQPVHSHLCILGINFNSSACISQRAAKVLQVYMSSRSICIVDGIVGVQLYGLCISINCFCEFMICTTKKFVTMTGLHLQKACTLQDAEHARDVGLP